MIVAQPSAKQRDVPEESDSASEGSAPSVGTVIRRLRREKGMSLQDLAQASGVSVGMLSQVERDLTNPSIRVVTGIRRALGAEVSDLFQEPPKVPQDPEFVRRASRRPRLEFAQLSKELLSSGGNHNLQFMILHIQPGGSSGDSPLRYPAEKGGMILSGALILKVGNDEAHLAEGDSFVFDSSQPHSFRNPLSEVTKVLWIIGAVPLDRHL
jgi:transcriptional regulator with XRE-family HTH domain